MFVSLFVFGVVRCSWRICRALSCPCSWAMSSAVSSHCVLSVESAPVSRNSLRTWSWRKKTSFHKLFNKYTYFLWVEELEVIRRHKRKCWYQWYTLVFKQGTLFINLCMNVWTYEHHHWSFIGESIKLDNWSSPLNGQKYIIHIPNTDRFPEELDTLQWPLSAARWSGVRPSLSVASTLAP